MINNTLKQVEEEFDREFNLVSGKYFDYPNGLKVKFTHNDIKSFLKSLIIKVLEQLVEREEEELMNLELLNGAKANKMFKRLDMKESIGWNKKAEDTISYLKSEIAKLSTNIDKE